MTQSVAQAGSAAARQAARAGAQVAVQVAANQAAQAANNLLFGPAKRITAGRSLEEIRLLTAGEGGGVPRVYGRARVGGQIIWASEVREETTTFSSLRGAKGTRKATSSSQTENQYFVSLAIALCEGEIARIGRVWADGKLITLADFNFRLYHGTNDQQPDTLIEHTEGSAPAYRGLAYIVFEDLPLATFGNRVPQLNFEVERHLAADDPIMLEKMIRAMTIIPGSGETVYATEALHHSPKEGVSESLNVHNGLGVPDFTASMDDLQGTLPATEAVALVVSWFGDDLRAGHCSLAPGVERLDRTTEPTPWRVGPYDRSTAMHLSETDGRPSYGGTPSDGSVRQALRELKARGLNVMFHPFILMDIPEANGLPDPYGAQEQASFPWRGRITSDRAADNGTAAARTQVHAFFDAFDPMVLHYAQLAADEGGVEAFLLGSELRGLTQIQDDTGAFPAVDRLVLLLQQVRQILPSAKLSYGADWSEYFGHQPADLSGDIFYPLDAFWAHGDVDFIGIDNYVPLADWRDTHGHADQAVAWGPYDIEYLQSGIDGGEGYDWFYASDADRLGQVRTAITDGAYGDDWVYRYKDLWSWWFNPHTERRGGVKTTATPWVPQSKPFWFSELGCAAIDKGPNQPNVFVDPKSAESALPHFSKGTRDDRAQRALLEAHHSFWTDTAHNPVSMVYGAPMVRADRMFVYAWDARPYPEFPARRDVWADADNWVTGHWLNGRAGKVPLSVLIKTIADEAGVASVDASACDRMISGLTLPAPVSAREALEPLFGLYQLDVRERDGILIVTPRDGQAFTELDESGFVDDGRSPLLIAERVQDEELPSALAITYQDELSSFTTKTTEVRDETRGHARTQRLGTPVLLEQGEATGIAAALLAEASGMTEQVRFALPDLADGIEPGDTLTVSTDGHTMRVRITEMVEGPYRTVRGITTDPGVFVAAYAGLQADASPLPVSYGTVLFEGLDIPRLADESDEAQLWMAAFAEPWPGSVSVYEGEGTIPVASFSTQCLMGRLTQPLASGVSGRWDRAATLAVDLPAGGLSSRPPADILGGDHLCAVQVGDSWELLQFAQAVLQEDGTWHLSGLLRGRRGTEEEAALGAEVGARFVLLDHATPQLLPPDRWGSSIEVEVGPSSLEPGSYPFTRHHLQLNGTGARPFAPVHLKSTAETGGQRLSWIRRTRSGGDQWSTGDVPLGETSERYQVRVLDTGGQVLETLKTDQTEMLVDQPLAAVVTVAQRSSRYGWGREARLEL